MQQAEIALPRLQGVKGRDFQIIDFSRGITPWQVINSLPAAIYVTDPEGRITYFKEAAVALWGCRPKLGDEQWCARGDYIGQTARRCRTINARWLRPQGGIG
jgi:PAS domain-containing protein